MTSVGYGAAPKGDPSWRHVQVPELEHDARPLRRGLRVLGLLAARLWPGMALPIWHGQPRHRALMEAVAGLPAAELIVANDYTALPAGTALAARTQARLVYDTHEYAAGERDEEARWRLLYPAYIRAIERSGIEAGAAVTTVSEGIAVRLAADYGITQPAVVRNLPFYRSVPGRKAAAEPLVHYHGVIVPGRGLETLIDSVRLWRPQFRLRIQGPSAPDYLEELKARAQQNGVMDRIVFAPPAPADGLVASASEADIGIHVLPGFSHQNSYALPNKLFEYLMAGLAVVVTDLPEMRRIVAGRGVGELVEGERADAVAAAVNAMGAAEIEGYRQAALASARELCWEREKDRFLAVCGPVPSKRG
ncbi:glycosyltransferase [Bosea sp. WAO]|uniref:glycosyltransferase n=1 Tax=Bosea sp. WAO TaxID=406341 RepID=UPI001616F9A4